MKKLDKIKKYFETTVSDSKVELNYSNPLELLVATILSAQCTDMRVNKVTPELFGKYKSAEDYSKADPEVLEEEIRSTGFYRNKAKNIIQCCAQIAEDHNGEVPDSMEALIRLPGVWRKTANVILGTAFGQPAIVVDTHVKRVSLRLGLTESEDPDKVEEDLARLLPPPEWTRFSHQLLLFGRHFCKAKKPACTDCELKTECLYYKENI